MSTSVEFIASNSDNGSGYWDVWNQIYNYYIVTIGEDYNGWVNFTNLTIPAGSSIISAHIEFEAREDDTGTTTNVKCFFANAGSITPPVSVSGANSISLTSGVNWSSISSWTDGTKYDTPDLASDIQTVINRSDYVIGNNVLFIVKDNASSTGAHRSGYGGTSSLSDTNKAKLHVVYNPAPEFTMSGTVSRFGTGIDGVTITVSGVGTVDTSGGGIWSKSVPYNWTGTLTPTKSGETFTPSSLGHDSPTQADESGQNFTMNFYVTPKVSIAYTTIVPIYSYKTNINIVNIVYTTYIPSRNYYNISTVGITYSPLTPVIGTGFIEVRSRFKVNVIGERISLKFLNGESSNLILSDFGNFIEELYRRDSIKLNAKGNRISLKFQNNDSAKGFELQYLRLFEEIYEHQQGTPMNVKGNHLSFKFQNNTFATPFELQYLKHFGEVYENQ